MNQIVRVWDRYQSREKYYGPDAIDVDEETKIQFPLEETVAALTIPPGATGAVSKVPRGSD